ncbi:MAG: hypothetical protein NXI23_03220 [Bacteroidetes bacterium]|jgi:hypothetical protein|nr:hypothetical protein [Bacteroidota bacterium]MDF1868198.1 hypothetical protein [Saprospiraceae bacterium]
MRTLLIILRLPVGLNEGVQGVNVKVVYGINYLYSCQKKPKIKLNKALEIDADYMNTYFYIAQSFLRRNRLIEAWNHPRQSFQKRCMGFGYLQMHPNFDKGAGDK